MTSYEQMREALRECHDFLMRIDRPFNPYMQNLLECAIKNAEAALALPRRNCDVGTAEEHGERCLAQFEQWRRKGDGRKLITAIMAWAQMPYTAEKGGEKQDSKVHAAVSIMGRESINKQCWECANCNEPTAGYDRSKFRCAFLAKEFGTWHYDVPNECPCKGKGWIPKKKDGGAPCER